MSSRAGGRQSRTSRGEHPLGRAMLLVFPLAVLCDWLAWLLCARWRELSEGSDGYCVT